ncbi:MAG: Holliday junction branch migration protein RuvA [Bacteroidetes bacterium]|jgi:Holliday junction DNA helicase RuvA|nr:Holliday junction branch migration protein RuvA [Bacteroidota bacterium]
MAIFRSLCAKFEHIMIAFLQGNFVQLTPAKLIVDVGGVGYEVNISLNTYEAISKKEKGLLHTYLHITENSQVLFGFFDQQEKELFLQLISVSGVGASTARMMLSGMQPEEIIRAIVQGDARQLEQIKGIGKKSAERLVLELRDKLSKVNMSNNPTGGFALSNKNTPHQDAVQALVSLGIQKVVAEKAVDKTIQSEGAALSLEALIKAALKHC